MNTKLKFLFEKYDFSDKDKFEVFQFYSLLTNSRKKHFLENFDTFAIKLQKIDKDIEVEKELLVNDAANVVRDAILENRKKLQK